MKLRRVFLAISLLTAALLRADQVTLKNGDRITGSIVSSDEKSLVLKTEAMGEVKIDRTAILSLLSEAPLTVTLVKGEKLVGSVRTEDVKALIVNAQGGAVTVPYQEVAAVRDPTAQAAWEREELRRTHPPLLDFWSGTVGLNLASSSGNARTTTFGTGATAQRSTGVDKIAFTYSQIYSRQSTTEPYGATANRVSGAVSYNRNFGPRFFTVATNSYDYDGFLDLDLRSVVGGGLGFHAYKSPSSYWDLALGGDWNREAFGPILVKDPAVKDPGQMNFHEVPGFVRNSGEMNFTETSSHQLTSVLKLLQQLEVFPNLSKTGAYRVNFDGGASFKLTRALSWNVMLTDRRLSNPPEGKKKNDMLLTTGIGISFEQK